MTIAPSNRTSVDNKLEEWLEQLKAEETIVTTIVEFLQQYLESNLNEKI